MSESKLSEYLKALKNIESGNTGDIPLDIQNREIGLSGVKLISALQKLTQLSCQREDQCYLEVGTYRGLTLLSVASANKTVPCFGIDNFSQVDNEGTNEQLIHARASELQVKNAFLIKSDFEAAFENLNEHIGNKTVGSYFIDGPHDYRSQLVCLTLARKYLSRESVIFIDDSNYEHVRQANKDFLLAFPEYKLLFEAYGKAHPNNLPPNEHKLARENYWNGLNILVHDPENKLKTIYPPTSPNRTRYVNEHIIHSSAIAEIAPQAINFVASVRRPWKIPKAGAMLAKAAFQNRELWHQRFLGANTYSKEDIRFAETK